MGELLPAKILSVDYLNEKLLIVSIGKKAFRNVWIYQNHKLHLIMDESQKLPIKEARFVSDEKSQNVDNVYHLAFANGVIITAGQDRRVGVYQEGKEDYHIKSDFLVYCVGISPSGRTGVYSSGEKSDLQLFDTKTKQKLDTLVGHKGILTQIKFINETELFSSARDHYVYYWKLHKQGH